MISDDKTQDSEEVRIFYLILGKCSSRIFVSNSSKHLARAKAYKIDNQLTSTVNMIHTDSRLLGIKDIAKRLSSNHVDFWLYKPIACIT